MVGEPEMSHELQHSEHAVNSIKVKAKQLYPQLDFGAERIRNRPDPEARVLINDLYELGKAKEPQRIILNMETKDVEKEFERIKKTGAKVIKAPYNPGEASGMLIATFADPDGNYFQLMSPWEDESSKSN